MVRIVFGNGDIIDCENISKIYIEGSNMDIVTIVDSIPKEETDE